MLTKDFFTKIKKYCMEQVGIDLSHTRLIADLATLFRAICNLMRKKINWCTSIYYLILQNLISNYCINLNNIISFQIEISLCRTIRGIFVFAKLLVPYEMLIISRVHYSKIQVLSHVMYAMHYIVNLNLIPS